MKTRARIEFSGIVQGVGFRPFIHKLASAYNFYGWVKNTTEGVIVELEGEKNKIAEFSREAFKNKPAPSKINEVKILYLKLKGYKKFYVKKSSSLKENKALVTPDISICPQCSAELTDSVNRRCLHPFISCTDCGPRFTIIKSLPYDRERTTMDEFNMCPECFKEYIDISSRRYHTQPIACNDCGPEVVLVNPLEKRVVLKGQDAIRKASELIKGGKILAIKSLGGFHLACDASSAFAVIKLRKRKNRPFKPLAVMSAGLEAAGKICHISRLERPVLSGWQHPITLLDKKPYADSCVARETAPNNASLGVMLPYTPLHFLLFNELKKKNIFNLIMTSGNLSEEPIEVKNKTAMKHLAAIADYYLVHNREIYNRCDDSIVRVIKAKGGKTPDEQIILRRARGYVPLPFELGIKKNSILACGAEENSTFCLTKDKRAFMSQYIGDLKSFCNMDYYRETIERFKGIFHIKPEVLAFDMHPDYFSTQYAIDYAHSNGCSLIPVQHHHAHLAGCMLENNLKKRVIGVIFDGTGYGADGRIWGGEWLIGDYKGFTRAAYLKYTAMPGGDMVVEEPWRMAISYLHNAYGGKMPDIGFVKKYRSKIQPVAAMIENGINSPFSSSMGRLFDGVAALLGICEAGTYDAQPAMELEYAALSSCKRDNYPAGIEDNGSCCIVDTGSIIRAIVEDIVRGTDKADIALKFHFTVVNTTVKICCIIRDKTGLNDVVLSGGVFQNKIILQESIKKLISGGFSVHFNRQYPCNDGGISFGQMAVAIHKLT